MTPQEALMRVIDHHEILHDEMRSLMDQIIEGKISPELTSAIIVGLRVKRETIGEIVAASQVMRNLATKVDLTNPQNLVDTCGTGGDAAHTFNISTTAAFVAAAAGARIAKHGGRSVSSKSGSADVLETLGVNINQTSQQVAQAVNEIGVGFMFAPAHHSAMKHAIGPRKELAVRTIFNVLGPLTNPAKAPNQVMGVYDKNLIEPIANVLKELGSRHVMVVHSDDGLDEFSIADKTYVAELKDGNVSTYSVHPEDFGLTLGDLKDIRADNADASLALITEAFSGRNGTAKSIISLNAGAAIYVSGLTTSLQSGIDRANQVLSDGSSQKKLDEYIKVSNS